MSAYVRELQRLANEALRENDDLINELKKEIKIRRQYLNQLIRENLVANKKLSVIINNKLREIDHLKETILIIKGEN